MQRGASVTTCCSNSKNIAEKCKRADIIISCVGKLNLITRDHINDNSVVIDVGINYNEHGKLEGDMPKHLQQYVKLATPVPGGVGPMTIAMLLNNLVKSTLDKIN